MESTRGAARKRVMAKQNLQSHQQGTQARVQQRLGAFHTATDGPGEFQQPAWTGVPKEAARFSNSW